MGIIDIILTVDYEIHGNGQGKFEDFCYRPTEKMLDIANRFNAKITFMVEMEHYFAMKKYPAVFKNEIFLFEKQLNRAVAEGHDVQLHLHPQWVNAELVNNAWKFPYAAKEIALFCNDYELAYKHIKKSKEWLENNLKKIDEGYECIGFRAGYFQMQPSFNITRALLNNGIICDTSVAKGMYRNNDNVGMLDYRTVGSQFYPYRASTMDISIEDNSSLLMEMPIFTIKYNKILNKLKKILKITDKKHKIADAISKIQRSKVPLVKSDSGYNKIEKNSKRRFSIYGYKYVDFCIGNPHELVRNVKRIAKKSKKDIPLVFMGHSKDFVYSNHFVYFLKEINKLDNVTSIAFRSAIRKYDSITKTNNIFEK
jgi:hypothetical protein